MPVRGVPLLEARWRYAAGRRHALACAAVAPLAVVTPPESELEQAARELSEVCAMSTDHRDRCRALVRVMMAIHWEMQAAKAA